MNKIVPNNVPDAEAILLLMDNSADEIVRQGTSNWVLNYRRARNASHIVCCRKQSKQAGSHNEMPGSAFLVGLIASLDAMLNVRNERGQQRFRIGISRYALLNHPNVWDRAARNPVAYKRLSELDFNMDALTFHDAPTASRNVARLTIAEAKRGLAETFGVAIDDIEIIIRG